MKWENTNNVLFICDPQPGVRLMVHELCGQYTVEGLVRVGNNYIVFNYFGQDDGLATVKSAKRKALKMYHDLIDALNA